MNATATPFHSSCRTALSLNTDATTGLRVQTMTTSRLELTWLAGELRIDCRTSRVMLDATRDRQKPGVRGARGNL